MHQLLINLNHEKKKMVIMDRRLKYYRRQIKKTDSKESKIKSNKSHDNTWNVVHHKNNKLKKMKKSSEKSFSKKEMSVEKIKQSLISIEGESKQNKK